LPPAGEILSAAITCRQFWEKYRLQGCAAEMSGDVAIGASLSWRDPRLSGLYDCRFART
jgi:hypothetical protein